MGSVDDVTWTQHRLPIRVPGAPPSHLAVQLAVPADGAEQVVLYLHGFGSSQSGDKAEFFRRRFLARGLAVCSLDFQGHGESGGTMHELTLTRNLSDIALAAEFLDPHGYGQLLLMGSSMGGASALWYASRYPVRTATVLTLAPAIEMAAGMERWAGPEGVEAWRRDGRHDFQHDHKTYELSWGLLEDLWTYDLDELAAQLTSPSLILQGKLDTSVSWRAVTDFATSCSQAPVELHLFGDADHRMVDRLDHLWSLVDGFLTARGFPSRPGSATTKP